MELSAATWTEVADAAPRILLVPVGSCEQHGPHLPLDTDTRIAVTVAQRVASTVSGVGVAPPVVYGSSGEHQSFPGTLSIGTDALTRVLVELGRSALAVDAPGALRGVVFVNGHGGNQDAVRAATETLAGEGRAVAAWSPRIEGGDAHAGRTETALLLAIDASSVRPERPVGETTPIADLLPTLRERGVRAVSESGVLGDSTGATADEGVRILADLVDDLALVVTALGPSEEPHSRA